MSYRHLLVLSLEKGWESDLALRDEKESLGPAGRQEPRLKASFCDLRLLLLVLEEWLVDHEWISVQPIQSKSFEYAC